MPEHMKAAPESSDYCPIEAMIQVICGLTKLPIGSASKYQDTWEELRRLARLGAAVEAMGQNSMLCRFTNPSLGEWWTYQPDMGGDGTDKRGKTAAEVFGE